MANPNSSRSQAPELLADLESHAARLLQELANLDKDVAEHLANEIAFTLSQHWGGQNLYVPQSLFYTRSRRNDAVWAAFTGHNQAELARRFKISVQFVYRIIKLKMREEAERRQGRLDLEEPVEEK
jgi:Mor family transcriptional regulator